MSTSWPFPPHIGKAVDSSSRTNYDSAEVSILLSNTTLACVGATLLLVSALPAISQSQVPPNPDPAEKIPSAPLRVGGDVTAPRATYNPNPDYSDEALAARRSGTCVLRLVVDANGEPQNVTVVRRVGMGLDEKAVAAVRTWRWEPARKDGVPVAVEINVQVSFSFGGKPSRRDKEQMAEAQARANAKRRELLRTMVNRIAEDPEPRACRASMPPDNKEGLPIAKSNYRLQKIAFSHNTGLTNVNLLRTQFPIKDGDPFDPALIAKGMDNLNYVFGTLGYLNFAGVPETKFDAAGKTASIDVTLNEGKQFFVSRVDFIGVDEKAFKKMRKNLLLKPGDIYNQRLANLSIARYASLARAPDPAVNLLPDKEAGVVAVSYDFRPCQTN